jgi:hypothetical protein
MIKKMKTALTLLTILLFSFADATGQTIPNAGFENWTTDIWQNDNPDNWDHSNLDIQPAKIFVSPGYQSNWALGAISFGGGMFAFAKCKFPVISHPASLNAFVKTEFSNIDSVNIEIFIYHNGLAVDSGKWINTNLSPIATWTPISISITQSTSSVDSVEIRINGGVQQGTILYVDELSYSLTNGINENNPNGNLSIFPNPFSKQTTLQSNNLFSNATLTIGNCFGHTVKQIKSISGQTITIQRDNLPSGLYFIRLTQDNKIITTDKLIITD